LIFIGSGISKKLVILLIKNQTIDLQECSTHAADEHVKQVKADEYKQELLDTTRKIVNRL